jgi:hypothetical protein
VSAAFCWLGRHWPRVVAGLALAVVAAVTGRVSYIHIEALTLALHQSQLVAQLMPFGVDGLIVVGSVVLLQASPGQPWLGWLGVAPGAAASLFANVESGIKFGWLAAAWAGVPSAAFFLATFLLERWLKAQAGQGGNAGQGGSDEDRRIIAELEAALAASQCPHRVAPSVEDAVVNAFLHQRDCVGEKPSQRHLSIAFGLSRPKVAELVGSLSLNGHGGDPS